AVRKHDTRHEVEVVKQAVFAGAIPDELRIANHRLQPILERSAVRIAANAEPPTERLQRERLAGPLHLAADLVPGRDRMRVAALAIVAGRAFSSRHQDKIQCAGRALEFIRTASYNERVPLRKTV